MVITKLQLLTLLQLVGLGMVSACSPVEGTKQWNMEKTLFNAPAVVIATDIYHSHGPDDVHPEPEDNIAIFEVDCIMKSGGYTIGRNISIYEGAVRDSAACHTTFTDVGTKYILVLEQHVTISNESFLFYEPNPLTSGGYEATTDTLEIVSNVCGLNSPQATPGAGTVEEVCPTVPSTQKDCATGGGSSTRSVEPLALFTVCAALWCYLMSP